MVALCVCASCVRYGGSVGRWERGRKLWGHFRVSTIAIKKVVNGKRARKKFQISRKKVVDRLSLGAYSIGASKIKARR